MEDDGHVFEDGALVGHAQAQAGEAHISLEGLDFIQRAGPLLEQTLEHRQRGHGVDTRAGLDAALVPH